MLANINQTSSKSPAISTCILNTSARRLLDVCSMFVRSCKRGRLLSRRLAPPPLAGIIWRRRRRKTDGAPPSQPKLWGAAATEIFTAHRGLQWL